MRRPVGGRGRFPFARSALVAMAAAASMAVAGPSSVASAAKAPIASVEAVDAMAASSLVYVQVDWRGWVVLPRNLITSQTATSYTYVPAGTYGPIEATTSCSGFVVSSSADIVTAGHCVDGNSLDGGKGAVVSAMLAKWLSSEGQQLSPAEIASRAALIRANARVEGEGSGSPVDSTVKVTLPAISSTAYPAGVTSVVPFARGDVALLSSSAMLASGGAGATTLPVSPLPVAANRPTNGQAVVAAGYPGALAELGGSSAPASYKPGVVSGSVTLHGVPFTEISSGVSSGMSGGPVLNMNGEAIGTVSWYPSGTTSSNFMTDTNAIRSLLSSNGVKNTPSAADTAYRQGLVYFFARQYHNAADQFQKALSLKPGLTLASQYLARSKANYHSDVAPPSSGPSVLVYALIGGAALLLLGGSGFFVARSRRRRAVPPSPPPAAAPMWVPAPSAEAFPTPVAEAKAPVAEAPPENGPVEAVAEPAETSAEEYGFCPTCGAKHPGEAHFCEKCGHHFLVRAAGKQMPDGDGAP